SSRRRHTRSYGDWSSDVCSSDLLVQALHDMVDRQYDPSGPAVRFNAIEDAPIRLQWPSTDHVFRIAQEGLTNALKHAGAQSINEIGRASCRERMERTGGAGARKS